MAEHCCPRSDALAAELAVLRLIHFLRPYLPSSPPLVRETRTVWVPAPRAPLQRQADRDTERRIRTLHTMAGIRPPARPL